MSAEFSLLQHLGVRLDGSIGVSADSTARGNTARGGSAAVSFRVWSPMRYPPTGRPDSGSAEELLSQKRHGPKVRYAVPSGEVVIRDVNGESVEHIIYNSKVPSIHGVNKQMAEERRAAKKRGMNNFAPSGGLDIGLDEMKQEDARRQLLRELQACNREQAERKREEQRRDRASRIAHGQGVARESEDAISRQQEADFRRRQQRQQHLREAAERSAEIRAEREAEAAAARANQSTDYLYFLQSKEAEEQRRKREVNQTRAVALENQRMAEAKRLERQQRSKEERGYAQMEAMVAAQRAQLEKKNVADRKAMHASSLRRAQEEAMERKYQQLSAKVNEPNLEALSLFQNVEQRERLESARIVARNREDQAINARIAEKKRQEYFEQRTKEQQVAHDQAEYNRLSLEVERKMSDERKQREREAAKVAMESAIAAKKERREAEQSLHCDAADPFLFWSQRDEAQTDGSQQRKFYEDVRRMAEKKRQERLDRERVEAATERKAIALSQQAAREEERRERERERRAAKELRCSLEAQISLKKSQHERAERWPEDTVVAPVKDPVILYRCPVTGEVLPAEAFDFGVRSGR